VQLDKAALGHIQKKDLSQNTRLRSLFDITTVVDVGDGA
jgi:hypothetical protein